MNKNELNDFFDSISPDEEIKKRVLVNLLKGEEKKVKFKRKIPVTLAAAIILIAVGITALAAVTVFNEKFVELFNISEQQAEVLEGSAQAPEASATDNGVTVNVLNTLVDNHGIYTLYEVLLPENVKITKELLDNNLQWKFDNLYFKTEEAQSTMGMGGGSRKIVDFSEHKLTILKYDTSNQKILNNQELTLELEDLVYFTYTENDIIENTLIDCKFSFSWELVYENLTKVIEVNKNTVIYPGKNNILTQIEVSPMSVWINIEGDDTMMAAKPVIKFKNGETIEFDAKNGSNVTSNFANFLDGREGGIITFGYNFDEFHDMSEYESIIVGDLEIKVN